MMLRWLRRRSTGLLCVQFVEVITDYLEGALPARERDRLEQHLGTCPHCTRYLEQLRITIALTGRLRVEDVEALAPAARTDLLAAFRSFQLD